MRFRPAIPLMAAALDQVLVSAANFCTFLLAARLLSAEAAGSYSLVFAAIVIASGVQNALVGMPLKVLGSGSGFSGFARRQFAVLLALIALEVLLLLPVGLLFQLAEPGRWILIVLVLVASQLHEFARARQLAELRSDRLLSLDALTYLVRFLVILIQLKVDGLSLDGLLWAMLSGYLCWLAFALIRPSWTELRAHFDVVWRFAAGSSSRDFPTAFQRRHTSMVLRYCSVWKLLPVWLRRRTRSRFSIWSSPAQPPTCCHWRDSVCLLTVTTPGSACSAVRPS